METYQQNFPYNKSFNGFLDTEYKDKKMSVSKNHPVGRIQVCPLSRVL